MTNVRAFQATAVLCASLLLASAPHAGAQDAGSGADASEFGTDLGGAWEGRGTVLRKITDERPLNVKCEFDAVSEGAMIELSGECGALFVKRQIRFALQQEAERVRGTYDAQLRTGEADLEGRYADGGLALEIDWGAEVNGDKVAEMQIDRIDPSTLRIRVTDIEPQSGERVITSDLTLTKGG